MKNLTFFIFIFVLVNGYALRLNIGENHTAILGSDIELSCDVECHPNEHSFFVIWYFREHKVGKNNTTFWYDRQLQNCSCDKRCYLGPYIHSSTHVTVYHIYNFQLLDMGLYTCEVENSTSSRSSRTFLDISSTNNEESAHHLLLIVGVPLVIVIIIVIILVLYGNYQQNYSFPYYNLS
jgi:hypothetical protein